MLTDVTTDQFLQALCDSITRGIKRKLDRKKVSMDVREHSFSSRATDTCNANSYEINTDRTGKSYCQYDRYEVKRWRPTSVKLPPHMPKQGTTHTHHVGYTTCCLI